MEQEVISEKRISEGFKKWVKKAFGEDLDKIDVLAEFDPELTISENREIFTDKFSSMFCKEYVEELNEKDLKEKAKNDRDSELSQIRKEEKELIENWKKSDYEDINIRSFDTPKHFLKMVCRGLSNSCILVGSGGFGKTYMSINVIKEEKADFEYQNTYTTPLELYKLIFENRNKIIIFDDVEGLLTNLKCLAILKASLWETDGKRMVTMNTSDKVLQGIPRIFEFKGKIIILSNHINLVDEHISALVSRTNYFELKFSYKEKLRIMKQITKKSYKKTDIKLRQKALELLIKNTDITTQELNFRTLIKTYDLLLYDKKNAEKLLIATIKVDTDLKLVMELIKSNDNLDIQKQKFYDKTGKSRATFFRLKRQIKELMK